MSQGIDELHCRCCKFLVPQIESLEKEIDRLKSELGKWTEVRDENT
jgi:hypothetical protein